MTTIPDAAIEAAARALCERFGDEPDMQSDEGWPIWCNYREEAAAVLTAALPHLTPAPQAERDVREALAEAEDVGQQRLEALWDCLGKRAEQDVALERVRALLVDDPEGERPLIGQSVLRVAVEGT